MSEILTKILDNPATAYILSFGGLGFLISLALNSAHKFFKPSERAWGFATLAVGALGGVLLQAAGLVTLPGVGVVGYVLSAFVGAACSAAAAGFSAVDLRRTITKAKGE